MKRSESIFRKARHSALISILLVSVSSCCGAWAAGAWVTGSMWAGFLSLIALVALFAGAAQARECVRLLRIAHNEARCEWERSIRPRI